MGVIDDFIAIARKEVGYKECGNNITKYNEWADNNSVWFVKVQGYAWCATFVAWCINELAANYLLTPTDFYCDNKCCWADRWRALFKDGMSLFTVPQIGDLAFRNGHVGIVANIDIKNNQVDIIEGNVGNSVNIEWYEISYWLAFGRPNWNVIKPRLSYTSEATSAKEFVINQGIYIGKDDGEMHWEDNLTREEMALILYRYWRKFNK